LRHVLSLTTVRPTGRRNGPAHLIGWRFWAVVLGFFGCIWISLFVLNSDVLLVGLLVVFAVGAIFLRITGT
jgi:hypothetical protein